MKGFTSIPAERLFALSIKAIAHIEDIRKQKLDEAVKEIIEDAKKQTFFQKLFGIVPKPIDEDDALLILMKEGEGNMYLFGSRYYLITNMYEYTFKEMHNLRKASMLVDGNILVDIETSAYLQKIEEKE